MVTKELESFLKKVEERKKADLGVKLQPISAADEHWLGHGPNTVDEQCSSSLLDDTSSSNPMEQALAERQVEEALDELVAIGALEEQNRMNIEEFLNPVEESHVFTESTDLDIYNAVMEAVEARRNFEINGGDDGDDDGDIEPQPSRREVLQAASVISRYSAYINHPIAREMEAILESFKRIIRLEEAQKMKDSVLKDFSASVNVLH
ncbi:hypothetical protein BYT27DRAFT_7183490 [Phlegmacium glaucopus]|nr:hypothetical protein BYT27DRAFT_7183490 [Phlegmacium glaucopus]